MSNLELEQGPAESHFSSPEAVEHHGKAAKVAARLALAAVGIATIGGALMAGRPGSEAGAPDLRAPVAAVSYYNPDAGGNHTSVFAAGSETPISVPREQQPGAAYLEQTQELHDHAPDESTVLPDTPSADIGWRPDRA